MKKAFRALLALVRENWALYLSAIFATAITVMVGFAIPLVLSETVDVVLADLPSSLPPWIRAPFSALGGRALIRQHYWAVALGVVLLNLVSGVFSYIKERNTAMAGRTLPKACGSGFTAGSATCPSPSTPRRKPGI